MLHKIIIYIPEKLSKQHKGIYIGAKKIFINIIIKVK